MCYVHVAALVAEYLRRKGALIIYFHLHDVSLKNISNNINGVFFESFSLIICCKKNYISGC